MHRIRPLLKEFISPNQSSFIPNIGTDVNIIIASEILHSMHNMKGKKHMFALKLDLDKAYDRLEWRFIHECLLSFNFSRSTIELIMECITSNFN